MMNKVLKRTKVATAALVLSSFTVCSQYSTFALAAGITYSKDVEVAMYTKMKQAKDEAYAAWKDKTQYEIQQQLEEIAERNNELIAEEQERVSKELAELEERQKEQAALEAEAKQIAEDKSIATIEDMIDDIRALQDKINAMEINTDTSVVSTSDSTVESIDKGDYISYSVKQTSDFKSYMDYRAIKTVSSAQYKLQYNGETTTGDYGIRVSRGRYCIAVGSRFTTTIGTDIDVVLENGTVLNCVLADCKADKDTDSSGTYHKVDGSVIEFVVDKYAMDSTAKIMGSYSSLDAFKGKVVEIRVRK